MASGNNVRQCLQDIAKADMELTALLQDIRNTVVSREDLDSINTEAREKMNSLRSIIKELERIGQEEKRESDRLLILSDVDRHKKALMSSIVMMRKANVAALQELDNRMKEQLLFHPNDIRKRPTNTKQSLVRSASEVTDVLLSISSSLASQVECSRDAIDSLASSSKVVHDTHDEFKGMAGHIQGSRRLLTKYGRREFTDKLIITLALIFFVASIFYVVKKRIWSS